MESRKNRFLSKWIIRTAPTVVETLFHILPGALVQKLTGRSKEQMKEFFSDRRLREKAVPKVGSVAPDFALRRLLAECEVSEKRTSLSSFRGRPLGLIFGSYTCPVFRLRAQELQSLYMRYCDRVDFLYVYGPEAHPTDGWVVPVNKNAGIEIASPTKISDRAKAACVSRSAFSFKMPMVLDDLDNAVDQIYGGNPARLYLIGADGHIVFQGGPGPGEFDPDAFEYAIENHLQRVA